MPMPATPPPLLTFQQVIEKANPYTPDLPYSTMLFDTPIIIEQQASRTTSRKRSRFRTRTLTPTVSGSKTIS
jgi:hypothetical protein